MTRAAVSRSLELYKAGVFRTGGRCKNTCHEAESSVSEELERIVSLPYVLQSLVASDSKCPLGCLCALKPIGQIVHILVAAP